MKKNKTQENIFTWGDWVYTDPYKVIEEIFEFAEVKFYRNLIKDILLYSTKTEKYKKEHAGNLIWLLDGIFCLLDACFVISKVKKYNVLESRDEDLLNTKFYSNRKEESHIWGDFPRTLSKEEFNNPYLAFRKLFKHWKVGKLRSAFKEMVEDACGSNSEMLEENTLLIYIQYTKLFEAAHLIYIREIAHVMNWRYE